MSCWVTVPFLLACSFIISESKVVNTTDPDVSHKSGSVKTLPNGYPTMHYQHSPVQSLTDKVSRRQPLTMAIIGGSNTAGGGVTLESELYYNILAKWWNKHMYPVTGSKLTNHKMAIGGTGSDFFSFCFQNFLPSKQPDIVLVELSINDYGYKYGEAAKPMELLTRRLLSLHSRPLVMYVNFVERGLYDNKITNTDCNNMEDLGFDDLAKHYGIPSVSWRDYVCPLTNAGSRELLNPGEGMFNKDGSHVEHKAHSQVAAKLIEHLKSYFHNGWGPTYNNATRLFDKQNQNLTNKRNRSAYSSSKSSLNSSSEAPFSRSSSATSLFEAIKAYLFKKKSSFFDENAISIPTPKFTTSINDNNIDNALCASFLTPDWKIPLKHSLTFEITQAEGFVYVSPTENKKNAAHLKFRTDSYGSWASKSKKGSLKVWFLVPAGSKRSVVLIFRTKDNKASTRVWLDDDKASAVTVDSNKCGHHMYQTRLESIATNASPGNHILNVESKGHGSFEVSGIIVGYPGYHDYEGYRPFDVKAKMWNKDNYKKLKC